MSRQRISAKHADFIGIDRKVADSPAFTSLPPIARALYLDLRRQHSGNNNGQIAAVLEGTEDRPGLAAYGWPSRSLFKNLKLLLEHGLIEKTRQGGIASLSKTCSLYAFTELAVVKHKEKGVEGSMPSLAYRNFTEKERAPRRRQKRVITAPHAAITAPLAATQLHRVPTVPLTTAPHAASDFPAKEVQPVDATKKSGNSDIETENEPQLHAVQSLINLPRGAVEVALSHQPLTLPESSGSPESLARKKNDPVELAKALAFKMQQKTPIQYWLRWAKENGFRRHHHEPDDVFTARMERAKLAKEAKLAKAARKRNGNATNDQRGAHP